MADSYDIVDGQVIPFHGGRRDTNTGTWRDATPLELGQQEQIAELEKRVDQLEARAERLESRCHALAKALRWITSNDTARDANDGMEEVETIKYRARVALHDHEKEEGNG